MPRRGGSGGGGFGGGSRSRPFSPGGQQRGYSTGPPSRPPTPPPARTPPAAASGKPPSMMRQMATTAGGVAAGTILAHAVIASLSPRERVPYYHDTYNRASAQELQDDPCGQMLKNLISCMQMAQEVGTDVTSICSQAEKNYLDCRERNGDPKY